MLLCVYYCGLHTGLQGWLLRWLQLQKNGTTSQLRLGMRKTLLHTTLFWQHRHSRPKDLIWLWIPPTWRLSPCPSSTLGTSLFDRHVHFHQRRCLPRIHQSTMEELVHWRSAHCQVGHTLQKLNCIAHDSIWEYYIPCVLDQSRFALCLLELALHSRSIFENIIWNCLEKGWHFPKIICSWLEEQSVVSHRMQIGQAQCDLAASSNLEAWQGGLLRICNFMNLAGSQ